MSMSSHGGGSEGDIMSWVEMTEFERESIRLVAEEFLTDIVSEALEHQPSCEVASLFHTFLLLGGLSEERIKEAYLAEWRLRDMANGR